MHSSDSNEAFKLFSANRSQGGFTMMYDELGSALTNSPAISLSVFSLSLNILTSRVCAVEEANQYWICAQEPCLHFIACSVVRLLFFGYATRKSELKIILTIWSLYLIFI